MNRRVRRAGRTAVSGVLVAGLVLSNSAFVEAKQVSKQESVYVMATADGSVQKITVADWLKDSSQITGSLKDSSNLQNINNVKGDEVFEQSGNDVNWSMSGNDIYYQGESSNDLPVDVKITYTLDGKEMTPEEMLGKSGKVTIHVSYTNTSKQEKTINGEKVDIYTPFVMLTGMILSSEHFQNIDIDNGKVVNDGSNSIIVGIGTPGLTESLDLGKEYEDNLTSDFTITADATDFEMSNTFTVASPNLLDELNIDEIGDPEELEEKLQELTDAATDLVDGTGKISDNMSTFAEKMKELKSSVKEYQKDGVEKITDGISTLADGGEKLYSGVKEYTDGVVDLSKGTQDYVGGAGKIAKGNIALYDAVKGLPEQIKTFNEGLVSYTGAVDTMGTKENAQKLKSGAGAVADGIATVNTSLTELKETFANNTKIIQGLKQSIELIPDTAEYTELKTQQKTLLSQLETATAGQKAAIEKLEAATAEDSKLKSGADTVSASVSTVMDGLTKLSSSSSTLTAGSKKLNESIPTLVSSVKELRDGSKKLSKNDKKLISGAKSLKKASKKMNVSVKKVKAGVNSLNKGGKQLTKATVKLVNGVTKLENASGKLSSGAIELDDGMNKFNRKGIIKLNSLYEDDIKEVLDRLDAVIDAGKAYKNFSGLNKGMDGEVKFIIETEAVEKED